MLEQVNSSQLQTCTPAFILEIITVTVLNWNMEFIRLKKCQIITNTCVWNWFCLFGRSTKLSWTHLSHCAFSQFAPTTCRSVQFPLEKPQDKARIDQHCVTGTTGALIPQQHMWLCLELKRGNATHFTPLQKSNIKPSESPEGAVWNLT